jgi:predicted TPR repeat methyltransferase
VDLSAAMLQRAGASGMYRHLVRSDIADHLRSTPQSYELLVAADVFIYVGALEAVFEGARRVLQDQGVFAFSIEAAPAGANFTLLPSSRYAHSRGYVESLAASHGFEVAGFTTGPLREEQRRPIDGCIVTLRRR